MQTSDKLNHVALIMDGNGRWATERRRPRVWGHVRGADVAKSIITEASAIGLKSLTLYAFSTENFSRPAKEIQTIFKILEKFIKQEKETVLKNNIKFKHLGNSDLLPVKIKNAILSLENDSKDNSGLILNLAFAYGGRLEIVTAVNKIIAQGNSIVSEAAISKHLYNPDCPELDLLIRTGGDQRISNFLLWQSAYAELYFTESQWPAFSVDEFRTILKQIANRERRFGNIKT